MEMSSCCHRSFFGDAGGIYSTLNLNLWSQKNISWFGVDLLPSCLLGSLVYPYHHICSFATAGSGQQQAIISKGLLPFIIIVLTFYKQHRLGEKRKITTPKVERKVVNPDIKG